MGRLLDIAKAGSTEAVGQPASTSEAGGKLSPIQKATAAETLAAEKAAKLKATPKDGHGTPFDFGDYRSYDRLRSWDDDSDGMLTKIRAARDRQRKSKK